MGAIVYWTIIRSAILIPILWLLLEYKVFDYGTWWLLGILSIYGVIIHPAVIQYQLFLQKNKEIIENTLCSSCKNFDKSAVLCLKYDKHPNKYDLPCEGVDWEPKVESYEKEEIND